MRSILSNLPTEMVRLFKPSGEQIDDIRANVQPGRIFVDDPNVIIEENDVFVRSLPNGAIEYDVQRDQHACCCLHELLLMDDRCHDC